MNERLLNAARVNRVDRLPYLHARATLEGRLNFSLVNAPGRVTCLPGLTFKLFTDPLSVTAY